MTVSSVVVAGGREVPIRRTRALGRSIRQTLIRPQFWFGLTILTPTIIWYGLFAYRPIFRAFTMSVTKYRLIDAANSTFVGLENFRQLFEYFLFPIAIFNTVSWALGAFLTMLPISVLVSVALVSVLRGRNFYQAIIFLPVVVSLVAVALLFRMLMDPEVGQFNIVLSPILEIFGLEPFQWLSDSSSVMATAVGIGVWKGLGFYVVIITAGMMNIPMELQDAATVDGVNGWQRFRFITMPLIMHTMLLITVMLVIGSLQEFTGIFVLTQGGPGNSTYMYTMLIYDEAFQQMRFGTATAAAIMQFFVILVITIFQLRVIKPNWSY